jgi:hypothetical protein
VQQAPQKKQVAKRQTAISDHLPQVIGQVRKKRRKCCTLGTPQRQRTLDETFKQVKPYPQDSVDPVGVKNHDGNSIIDLVVDESEKDEGKDDEDDEDKDKDDDNGDKEEDEDEDNNGGCDGGDHDCDGGSAPDDPGNAGSGSRSDACAGEGSDSGSSAGADNTNAKDGSSDGEANAGCEKNGEANAGGKANKSSSWIAEQEYLIRQLENVLKTSNLDSTRMKLESVLPKVHHLPRGPSNMP